MKSSQGAFVGSNFKHKRLWKLSMAVQFKHKAPMSEWSTYYNNISGKSQDSPRLKLVARHTYISQRFLFSLDEINQELCLHARCIGRNKQELSCMSENSMNESARLNNSSVLGSARCNHYFYLISSHDKKPKIISNMELQSNF